MKTLKYLFFLTLFAIAACNGSDTTSQKIPYTDPAVTAKIDALTQALAAATHADAQKFQSIQLIVGKPNLKSFDSAINFGPCPNGGIKVGQFNKTGTDEQTQVFKQAPTATCPGVYSIYDVNTGNLHILERIYYTTADCTGTPYVWDAGGTGVDRQKTEAGISFISPNPLDGGQMWVPPNTQAVLTQAQSAFIVEDGGCVDDGDLQPMWVVLPTTLQESGVALSLGDYQLSGL